MYVYSPALVNYLLISFKSNCTQKETILETTNRQEKGFEESKIEANDEKTKLDSRTFTQVL